MRRARARPRSPCPKTRARKTTPPITCAMWMPGHHVEQRAEDAVLQPEAQLRVVVQLQPQEEHAEPDRGAEPRRGAAAASPPRIDRSDSCTATLLDHQDHRQDRRDVDLEVRRCPAAATPARCARIVKYATEERGEEHRLRGDEQDHPEHGPAHLAGGRAASARRRRSCRRPPAPPSAGRTTGRSERIGGSESKLCAGGGEVVAHSSVLAPHGSSGAVRGLRSVMKMLTKNSDHRHRDHERTDRSRGGSGSSTRGRAGSRRSAEASRAGRGCASGRTSG